MGKRILAMDSQIVDAIQKCGFFTFLRFIKNYRPNGEMKMSGGPLPLERGSLGHELLEVYYKEIKEGTDWAEAVEKATVHGREFYQKLQLELNLSEWTIKTFHQYADYYQYDGLEVIDVEQTFAFEIYSDSELQLIYQGKIDLECKVPNQPETAFDHKWRAVKANYTPLDNQLIGYSIYKNSNLLFINEIGMQKSYEPDKKFRRVPIPIGDAVKSRWLKNTIQWGKILDHYLQTNTWPQSHLKTAPQGISQCGACIFNRICAAGTDEEMAEKIKNEFHLAERWDVGTQLTDDD